MRVALLETAGYVATRWAWSTQLRLADIEHGRVLSQKLQDVCDVPAAALTRLLGTLAPDTVVCGGIPPECERALRQRGVEVIWGVIGTSGQVLRALARGQLRNDAAVCARCGDGVQAA